MRIINFIIFCFIASHSLADEPSVAYECKDGLKTYVQTEGSRIDICPSSGDFKLDAVTFGSNYHMCWLTGVAVRANDIYELTDSDCRLAFTVTGRELNANFQGNCRYVCGARAWFKSGIYKQKSK
jgi:hypothetical protein